MLKVATDCSGIGSPEQALKNIGIPHEIVFACEYDKYARETYLANFTPQAMFEDMTTRDNSPNSLYADIYVAGIPCQSFSLSGKRLGELDPRGLLFYNFYDYVKHQKPKCFIIENVLGLLSSNSGKTFQSWLALLSETVNGQYSMPHEDSLLYNVHYTVLNSKDFGVPQSRERVFIVGFRNNLPNTFKFPKGHDATKVLGDILEQEVDAKYFFSDKMLNYFVSRQGNFNGGRLNLKYSDGVASTLTASSKSVDISDNLIVTNNAIGKIKLEVTSNNTNNELLTFEQSAMRFAAPQKNAGTAEKIELLKRLNLRRLTPLEYFRLQGYPDSYIKPCSDAQLYRQGGNSISVSVMQSIIKNILEIIV